MRLAQAAAARALRERRVDEPARIAYLDAVRRYFVGFEREARVHLRNVDKRMADANQILFNLSAERGVATKRIEATQGVLEQLDRIEEHPQR